MKKLFVLAAAGFTLASAAAFAQMQHHPSTGQAPNQHPGQHMMPGKHGGMMHGGMHGNAAPGGSGHAGSQPSLPKGDSSPSSLAFHGINMKMHSAMDIAFTGNADVDFVKGMIPHHEGAVEMAKTVLAFGKDPAVRKLAEEIVKAQESEISLMRAWLKSNEK